MNFVVFYHNDLDGKCSASIVKKSINNCKCYSVDYRNGIDLDKFNKGDTVIIVDFTPSVNKEFSDIVNKAGKVIWLDHHKVNIEKHNNFSDLDGIRSNTNPSACILTWKYFFPNSVIPKAVIYTSDYDTWTHEYSDSRYFETGMNSVDCNPESDIWKRLLNCDNGFSDIGFSDFDSTDNSLINEIINRGKIISDYNNIFSKQYLEDYCYIVNFDGYKSIVCNMAHFGSDFFNSINQDEYDLMIMYVYDGNQYSYSLYSTKNDVNCAEIAKQYGGGGHKGAAGFNTEELIF